MSHRYPSAAIGRARKALRQRTAEGTYCPGLRLSPTSRRPTRGCALAPAVFQLAENTSAGAAYFVPLERSPSRSNIFFAKSWISS
jgi:hypothetical protein